jgi:hypothetical protein
VCVCLVGEYGEEPPGALREERHVLNVAFRRHGKLGLEVLRPSVAHLGVCAHDQRPTTRHTRDTHT